VGAGIQVAEHPGQANPSAGTSALDGAFGDAEQLGGVGDRVALHIDGHYGGSLLDGQAQQRPLYQNRSLDMSRPIGDRIDVL